MKLLLDSCVWGRAADELRAQGHDVDWVGAWPSDPGDDAVLVHALSTGRVLVTLDKDFGELAVVRSLPHCGIVRLVAVAATRQAATLLPVLDRYAQGLLAGAIVTVEEHRIRVRPGDPESPPASDE